MSEAPSPKRALLVIDMQVGLFHGPDRPHDGERVLANINRLIHRAHDSGTPVFAVRHTGPAGSPIAPDALLAALLPELAIDTARDIVFDKTRPNCFAGTRLAEWLHAAGIGEIVIAGMKTQYCVDTTCRAAGVSAFARCSWPTRIPAWIRPRSLPSGSSRIIMRRLPARLRR